MKEKSEKRSFDCPDRIYHLIMKYGIDKKTYKFGSTIIAMIEDLDRRINGNN